MVFARTGTEAGHAPSPACWSMARCRHRARQDEEILGITAGRLPDTFSGVRLPADSLMGPENQAFKMAMSNFNFQPAG